MNDSNPFPSAQEKLALVGEPKMAAPNKQPARRGTAASVHTHGPTKAGMPATSVEAGNAGPGQGHTKAQVTKGTGKNANKLH